MASLGMWETRSKGVSNKRVRGALLNREKIGILSRKVVNYKLRPKTSGSAESEAWSSFLV